MWHRTSSHAHLGACRGFQGRGSGQRVPGLQLGSPLLSILFNPSFGPCAVSLAWASMVKLSSNTAWQRAAKLLSFYLCKWENLSPSLCLLELFYFWFPYFLRVLCHSVWSAKHTPCQPLLHRPLDSAPKPWDEQIMYLILQPAADLGQKMLFSLSLFPHNISWFALLVFWPMILSFYLTNKTMQESTSVD